MGHLPIDFALSKETCRVCGHQLLHDVSIEVPGTDTLWNLGNFAKTEISLKHTIFYLLLMVVYHIWIYMGICLIMFNHIIPIWWFMGFIREIHWRDSLGRLMIHPLKNKKLNGGLWECNFPAKKKNWRSPWLEIKIPLWFQCPSDTSVSIVFAVDIYVDLECFKYGV